MPINLYVIVFMKSRTKVIIVGSEYLSAIIAASDNVIEPSADFDPWFARHGEAEFIGLADQMSMK